MRIRPWLQREPGRFFLATKGDERTAAGAREELHRRWTGWASTTSIWGGGTPWPTRSNGTSP